MKEQVEKGSMNDMNDNPTREYNETVGWYTVYPSVWYDSGAGGYRAGQLLFDSHGQNLFLTAEEAQTAYEYSENRGQDNGE